MALSVVTGATRGIGLSLCRELLRRRHSVLATCRGITRPLAELRIEITHDVDVTSDAGVQALAEAVGERPIRLLVSNAGILAEDELAELDLDSVRRQFEVNALGPLRVVKALLPRLEHGAKVALITSRMGSIADNTSGGYYGYRMSKAALNMAGASLARDLAPHGVAVLLLHPGYVRTAMTGGHGGIDPDESARGLVDRIDELTLATSGSFLHMNGESLPW